MVKSRRILHFTAGAIIIAIIFAILSRLGLNHQTRDPDFAFHASVVREMVAQRSTVIGLPQFPDLGWQEQFSNPSYLFHVFLMPAYIAGGESGIRIMNMFFSFLMMLVIYYQGARLLGETRSAILVVLFFAGSALVSGRLLLVRPAPLAIAIFLTSMWMISNRRPFLAGILGVIYALSYSNVAFPGVGIFTALLIGMLLKDQSWVKSAAYFGLGILVGFIINPNFPSNIYNSLTIFQSALKMTPIPANMRPMELLTPQATLFFKSSLYPCILLVTVLLGLTHQYLNSEIQGISIRGVIHFSQTPKTDRLIFYFSLTVIALLTSVMTIRGIEYSVPLSAILTMVVLDYFAVDFRAFIICATLIVGTSAALTKDIISSIFDSKPDRTSEFVSNILSVIPKGAAHQKVFNCDWATAPYILNSRPDLQMVDIGDPIGLQNRDPDMSNAKINLSTGNFSSFYAPLMYYFKPQFTLCDKRVFNEAAYMDPHFTPIQIDQERLPTGPYMLYRVDRSPRPEFIKSYTVEMKDDHSNQALTWKIDDSDDEDRDPAYALNFEFLSAYASEKESKKLFIDKKKCVKVKFDVPAPAPGSGPRQFLGIGGGPFIRIYDGSKLIFSNIIPADFKRPISFLLELKDSLAKLSEASAEICNEDEGAGQMFVLSVWTEDSMRDVCKSRLYHSRGSSKTELASPLVGRELGYLTCIAPIVR